MSAPSLTLSDRFRRLLAREPGTTDRESARVLKAPIADIRALATAWAKDGALSIMARNYTDLSNRRQTEQSYFLTADADQPETLRALVLEAVSERPMRSAAIARELGTPSAAVRQALRDLTARGMVESDPIPGEGRALLWRAA